MACYHCNPHADDFRPCYAAVLAFKDAAGLRNAVRDAEKDIVPCFTAFCPQCRDVRLLTTEADTFSQRSAHHTHMIVLMRKLQSSSMLLK